MRSHAHPFSIMTDNEQKETFDANKIWSSTNGHSCFWLNIALIGDQSSGKTTLLNAILGHIVGETGHNRVTKTVQVYSESSEALENNNNNNVNDEKKQQDDSNDENKKLSHSRKVLRKTKSENKEQDDMYDTEKEKYKQYKETWKGWMVLVISIYNMK